MRWWWQRREDQPEDDELDRAKKKAEQLSKRVAKLLHENNLGEDIKKALGGGYQ